MGPWVHDIDPIIGTVAGVHLWWYGLSYSLGFLNAHVFFVRHRAELGLSMREVYELSLLISIGVLIGGRLLVVHNERAFYQDHLGLIPAVWIGGMATHGLILGGLAGVVIFCLLRHKPMPRLPCLRRLPRRRPWRKSMQRQSKNMMTRTCRARKSSVMSARCVMPWVRPVRRNPVIKPTGVRVSRRARTCSTSMRWRDSRVQKVSCPHAVVPLP